MSQLVELLIKFFASLFALLVLGLLIRSSNPFTLLHRRAMLAGLSFLGCAAYLNFGGLHTDGTALHQWDQLHYVLGSKYFPELGYDGIYSAMLGAREGLGQELPALTRDLRTMRVEPTSSLAAHRAEVRARFDSARWREFAKDATAVWIRDEFFIDHGYFPTPAHTAVSRLVSRWLPMSYRTMYVFASVDFLLLAGAALLIYAWTSLEVLAAMALMFGLGFCSRYYWVGGAFMRQDWLAAVLVAGAALHTRRFGLAGVLLGYASMVRVFPALFALPVMVHFLKTWRRERTLAAPLRFGSAYVASAVVLFAAGCSVGRGLSAWEQAWARIAHLARYAFPNGIGLRVPLVTSQANFMGELVDPRSLYLFDRISEDYASLFDRRFWWIAFVAFTGVAFALRAAWRARAVEAAYACGVVVIYAATAATGYYGSYFLALAFRDPLRTCFVFVVSQVLTYASAALVMFLASRGVMVLNGAAVFAPASGFLGGALMFWVARAIRNEPA